MGRPRYTNHSEQIVFLELKWEEAQAKLAAKDAEIGEMKEEVKEIVGRDGWVTVRQLKRLKLLLRIK